MKHIGIYRYFWTLILMLGLCQGPRLDDPELDDLASTWAYTKMVDMTLEEKIGQLFMIQANSDKEEQELENLLETIEKYPIGGVAFFQGSPEKQQRITAEIQRASTIPLLIAIDAEWGLGMRLDQTISFPRQFALGAIQDNRLIYDMGREIGREMKVLGVHLNFAPVADINSYAGNPVIADRSFGQDKKNVARKSYAYMRGLQDEGVMA